MKEKIKEKLEKNIERILAKEELLPTDVAILREKLQDIISEENEEEVKAKQKEMMEMFLNNNFKGE